MGKITKSFDRDFTLIHNDIIKDERIHLKTLGLFMYLWKQHDDWNFYLKEVVNHHPDGIDATRSAVKELEKYGYLTRVRDRNEKGQYGDTDWVLTDQPTKNVDKTTIPPKLEKSTQVKSTQDNATLISTNLKKYQQDICSSKNERKSKKKSAKDEQIEHDEKDVINYLNTTIQSDSYQSSKDLRTRLKEGYTPEQLKAVIYYCAISCNWMTSTNSDGVPMVTYLRPRTLFGKNNCREYLSDAKALAAANKAKQQKQLSKDSNDIDEEELYS